MTSTSNTRETGYLSEKTRLEVLQKLGGRLERLDARLVACEDPGEARELRRIRNLLTIVAYEFEA